jgi:hypothetical protein
VIIRQMEPTDSLATITELLHSAYARLGAMGFNYTAVDQTEETTRQRMAGGTCLVAADGSELIGTIMFYRPGRSKGCPWYEQPKVAAIGEFGVRSHRQDAALVPHYSARRRCWEFPAERSSSRLTRPREPITSSPGMNGKDFASSSMPSGRARGIAVLS